MITNDQTLTGAKTRFGTEIKTYDDGFGPLWVSRNTLGVDGIVRAQTFESADSCVRDEILPVVPLEDIQADPSEYYVCERDYHCEAPKDYTGGFCLCSKAENAEYRTCWKCRQHVHDHTKCDCTKAVELPHEVCLTLAEGYQYQDNFTGSGIVSIDLNGQYLDELTPELVKELEITLTIENDD